jgi:UDP-MurNAc hydroxylase
MKLKFINHSSFSVEHDGVFLVIDPWLEGKVFNNGWDLIVPSAFDYEDFSKVTHIWFSHEHPDHFFPPNISKIKEEYRKKIVVLFQETKDKRVVKYCKKMGFKEVIELKPDQFLSLAPDLKVMCELYQEGDSWFLLRSKNFTLFNTNDCGIRDKFEADKIRKKVGPIDLLLTQFSYAYWAGNPDQRDFRRKVADEKLEGLKFQVEMFKPKQVIPIASFVWFCHEENYFLNDEVNRPQKVFDFIKKQTSAEPVILYPGDEFWPGKEVDSTHAIARYNKDFERIYKADTLVKAKVIEEQELLNASRNFVANLLRDYGIWARLLRPARIWLSDYQKAMELSLRKGLSPLNSTQENCDCALGSESLLYNFQFPWGNDTLGINGRYTRPGGGNYSRFYNFFRYNQLANRGIKVGLGFFCYMALRRILVKAGLRKI